MSSDFKTLFVYFNDRMRTGIPHNIGYLSAALKAVGFETTVFDTSFYIEHERLFEEKKKEDAGIFKAIDYSSIGVQLKKTSLKEDLDSFIEKEKPKLIAFSVFSQAKRENIDLARHIKARFPTIPLIFGGIHVNVDPLAVLQEDCVDYVCVGEGEDAIVEFCVDLAGGGSGANIRNIGYKEGGRLCLNECRPPQSMDSLPRPDWEPFNPYHVYGPYRGKLLKMACVEYSRTCPYHCSYCGNEVIRNQYKKSGHNLGYRHKSSEKFIAELKYFKDNYGIEMVNITDGTFVAQKVDVLEKLSVLYVKEIDLPFFCDATVHCLTPRKVAALKRMGCSCVNMGLECANEEYRNKYLDRTMTNEKIIDAFLMVKEFGINTRSYNIIGLPFETRQTIMDTIELNRKCKVDSVSLSIFMPYEGTRLRELCIKEGLIPPDQVIIGDGTDPLIKNPYLTDVELLGLYNTFSLYIKLPKEDWPMIKKAENDPGRRKELMARCQ
ncbi:MAG: B12-binding domain-containing radical SAM protein [Syntrophorhabdaceae bacterium]